MNPLARFRSHVWLATLAFAGLVAGHWLSYLVVAPDPHARRELLASTGHGSHDLFLTLGLAAAVAAVIAVVAARLREAPAGSPRRKGIAHHALPLWLLQTGGFIVVEVAERVHGLHDLSTLLQEPAFLLGLAAQALVALAGSTLVFLLRSTVDVIKRFLCPPAVPEASQSTSPVDRPSFRPSVSRAAWNLRGPPIPAQIQG